MSTKATKPKITVGICTGGSIRVETVTSLISNIYNLGGDGIQFNLLFQIGGYVDVNRNTIVTSALNVGTTHLMFIDGDMIFPEDGIGKLLKMDKDVVGANYNVRLDPTSQMRSTPTVKMLVNGQPVSMLAEDFPTEPFKCYALPTGFMMIKTKVFEKLKMPYFDAWISKENKHTTEDIDFCQKVQKAGFEVWCDPTIKMGHIGQAVY